MGTDVTAVADIHLRDTAAPEREPLAGPPRCRYRTGDGWQRRIIGPVRYTIATAAHSCPI